MLLLDAGLRKTLTLIEVCKAPDEVLTYFKDMFQTYTFIYDINCIAEVVTFLHNKQRISIRTQV